MSKSKQKGTAWETECVRYLQSYTKSEFMRLPLVGTKDVGDIRCLDLPEFVFECKNRKDALSSLSEIMKETEQERINAEAAFGAAIVKRRNFGTGGAYVVMELHNFAQLIKERIHGQSNRDESGTTTSFY
ncbi:MAG: hypothetical protein CL882_03540 [Dehalococcoidia bacterium]|nr:hypothetical protein [Dehalococcoidia bacterium]